MNVTYETGLKRCKCGGKPKYRYSGTVHWVECRNKTCNVRTHYFPDVDETFDPKSMARALAEWDDLALK